MKHRTILSLCDHSGSWSQPYRDAGYDVMQLDLKLGHDVRLLSKPEARIHGILAAPPCTHFARSGAPHWATKGEAAILEGLSVVDACLRIVTVCRPEWWVLENPIGRLKDYLGEPAFRFDPCDFGDPYTKRTWLWGDFTPPLPILSPWCVAVHPHLGDITTKKRSTSGRSITPQGFARAFFDANP